MTIGHLLALFRSLHGRAGYTVVACGWAGAVWERSVYVIGQGAVMLRNHYFGRFRVIKHFVLRNFLSNKQAIKREKEREKEKGKERESVSWHVGPKLLHSNDYE